MKKIVIYGTTEMSEYLYSYLLRDKQVEVVAFTVENKYLDKTSFFSKEVIPFESIEQKYPPKDYEMIIAIGPTQMNKIREKYFNLAKEKGYNLYSYISKLASVMSPVGENNIIGDFAVIEPNSNIGDNNMIYPHTIICSRATIGHHNYISPAAKIGTNDVVGNNIILGMNSTLKTDITIANETLVGANCYISKNTEFKGVYGVKSADLYGCVSDKINMV